jgi:3-dehydroquinate synthetase
MRHDKKAQAGRMNFILARSIGQAFIARDVPEDAVRAVLAEN